MTNLIYSKRRSWHYLKSHARDFPVKKLLMNLLSRFTRWAIKSYNRNRELKMILCKNSRFFFAYINYRLSPYPVTHQLHGPYCPQHLSKWLQSCWQCIQYFFGSVFSRDNNTQVPNFVVLPHSPNPPIVVDKLNVNKLLHIAKTSSTCPDVIHKKILLQIG